MYVLLSVYARKGKLKKCILHVEWKLVCFVMVHSSSERLFHSLGLAPEKSSGQTNFNLYLLCTTPLPKMLLQNLAAKPLVLLD